MEQRSLSLLCLLLCLLLLLSLLQLLPPPSSLPPSSLPGPPGLKDFLASLSNQTTALPLSDSLQKRLFLERYQRPHRQMVKTFLSKPDRVLTALQKEVREEEQKQGRIQEEIALLRALLGGSSEERSERGSREGGGRRSRRRRATEEDLPPCPSTSPELLGTLVVRQEPVLTMQQVEEALPWVSPGGGNKPGHCSPKHKTAFIIPFRDREAHLAVWMRHMHPILRRQQLDYRVFVVEQSDSWPFNRAALMNAGVSEARRLGGDFSCFVFHDVDILPEDDRAVYTCPQNDALHLAVAVSRWKYRLTYSRYCGGITALASPLVDRINGFANSFYGWGGEDDDLYNRLKYNNITVKRYPAHLSRLTMLSHNSSNENPELREMMQRSEGKQLLQEGLSSLQYTVDSVELSALYTRILVTLPPPPLKEKLGWFQSLQKSYNRVTGRMANRMAEAIVDITKENPDPDAPIKIY